MVHVKILFLVNLIHAKFCPLADVKPVSNDLVYALPLQCRFALSLFVQYYLYGLLTLHYSTNGPKLRCIYTSDCAVRMRFGRKMGKLGEKILLRCSKIE
jgi:hypothetical protein